MRENYFVVVWILDVYLMGILDLLESIYGVNLSTGIYGTFS
jgi:hypothetical protein